MRIKKFTTFNVIVLFLALVFLFSACTSASKSATDVQTSNCIKSYTVDDISDDFDEVFYETENRIIAQKMTDKEALEAFVDVSLIATEKVYTSYDVEYEPEEDMFYLAVSTFDANNDLISVTVASAYPIRYADGTVDANIDVDGTKVLVSEILEDVETSCFFGTLFFGSLLVAKLVATLTAVVEAVAITTAVLCVAGVAYYTYSLTKEKIEARTKEAKKEKKKKNPQYYYPAQIKNDALLIAANPDTLRQAVSNVKVGTSYWAPSDYMAKDLVVEASGGYVGPEIDKSNGSPKVGYYYHYHCANRAYGVHSWYGTPYGGVYN